MRVSKTKLVSIAGMHFTMLAICVALLSGYVLHVHSTIDNLQLRVFREAGRINDIKVRIYSNRPSNRSDAERKELLNDFISLTMSVGPRSRDLSDAERGKRMYEILRALLNHYPFPEGKGYASDRCEFAIIAEIEEWQEDLAYLIRQISWAAVTYASAMEKAITAYSTEWRKEDAVRAQKLDNMTREYDTQKAAVIKTDQNRFFSTIDPKVLFYELLNTALSVRTVSEHVRSELDQLEMYKRRKPTTRVVLVILTAFTLFFVLAVLTPIYIAVHRSFIQPWLYRAVSLWVPLSFYIALLVGLFMLLRI